MSYMMDTKTIQQKATVRNAINVGFKLASSFIEYLEAERISPSNWPHKLSITIKQIKQLPEVDGNGKVAKRVKEAAHAIWEDMRIQAINIQRDMELHPELYEHNFEQSNLETEEPRFIWRDLSALFEQIAGNIFINEFPDEDEAHKNVSRMMSAKQLATYINDFDDDFAAFINEIREAVRNKKQLKASERLELICLLNVNLTSARKIIEKLKRKNAAQATKSVLD